MNETGKNPETAACRYGRKVSVSCCKYATPAGGLPHLGPPNHGALGPKIASAASYTDRHVNFMSNLSCICL